MINVLSLLLILGLTGVVIWFLSEYDGSGPL